MPEAPHRKLLKGFGARLFLTEDKKIFEDWSKPTEPKLNPIHKAKRNVPIFTVILFANPLMDSSNSVDVTCDITVRKPDGSIYGQQTDVMGWKGPYQISAPTHNLQLAQKRIGIRIEPQDPEGVYTVEAIVKDNVRKVSLP